MAQSIVDTPYLDTSPPVFNVSPVIVEPFIFVPEINYWATNVIENSSVEVDYMKKPVKVSETDWKLDGSVLDLLFNYTYNSDKYGIYYRKVSKEKITDKQVSNRISIYAGRLDIYHSDSTTALEAGVVAGDTTTFGMSVEIIPDTTITLVQAQDNALLLDTNVLDSKNIFNITFGENDMLSLLYDFKVGNTIVLNSIVYNDLPSDLSKLIYIFLNYELNNDTTLYETGTSLSTEDRLITWLFEQWLVNHFFRRKKFNPSLPFTDLGSLLESQDFWQIIELDQTSITDKKVVFPPGKDPINASFIFMAHDSHKQVLDTDYKFITNDDSTASAEVNWSGLGLESKVSLTDRIYLLWAYNPN